MRLFILRYWHICRKPKQAKIRNKYPLTIRAPQMEETHSPKLLARTRGNNDENYNIWRESPIGEEVRKCADELDRDVLESPGMCGIVEKAKQYPRSRNSGKDASGAWSANQSKVAPGK